MKVYLKIGKVHNIVFSEIVDIKTVRGKAFFSLVRRLSMLKCRICFQSFRFDELYDHHKNHMDNQEFEINLLESNLLRI